MAAAHRPCGSDRTPPQGLRARQEQAPGRHHGLPHQQRSTRFRAGQSGLIPMAHENMNAVEDEIARLRGLDLSGLQAHWRTMVGRRAPPHLPRHLLLRIIAYRLQADLHGDLDPATIRSLDRLAKAGSTGSAPLPDAPIRPGALLVREWNGVLHRVEALDQGFAWNGTSYSSLSQVARAITGTRWNGPRFFGLREVSR